jgi:hypothetical protein
MYLLRSLGVYTNEMLMTEGKARGIESIFWCVYYYVLVVK